MAPEISKKMGESIKVEVLKIERQFAYERTGAANARRSKVKEAIDKIVGEGEER